MLGLNYVCLIRVGIAKDSWELNDEFKDYTRQQVIDELVKRVEQLPHDCRG